MRAPVRLVLLMLAGCVEDPDLSVAPAVRASPAAASCPAGAPAPPAPRAPRTVEAIANWATAVERARALTEAARAECARRLRAMAARVAQD